MQSDTEKSTQSSQIRMYIGGEWRASESASSVTDPYRRQVVAEAPGSTARDCEDALASAYAAREVMAKLPGYERAAMLRRAADLVLARAADIARAMTLESGKAIRDSLAEVHRAAETLKLCAEEAVRIQGEHIPMDATAMGAGKIAMALRVPVGVVAAITPFNGPVNLAAHKLGPALAGGNTLVLKPSPKAPWCVHKLVECVIDAGAPAGAINVLYGDEVGPQLVADPRVDFISFTGSIPVGKQIRKAAGLKRVALELGGVGSTFVHHDADIEAAAKACARNAMALAGQSCISVQNVYVHKRAYDAFIEAACREVDQIRFGDPMLPDTDVGTLIDEAAACRVEDAVTRAVHSGARAIREGRRSGAQLGATVLEAVNADMEIVRDEIFGPAMTVQAYDHPDALFRSISDSPYGLQCGIFTNDLKLALQAIRELRTGGVIVNGTSRWRSDQAPYGGVKDSGIGREGPKFAIRDMTDERFFVFN